MKGLTIIRKKKKANNYKYLTILPLTGVLVYIHIYILDETRKSWQQSESTRVTVWGVGAAGQQREVLDTFE